jgi:beta-lactamase regulating signal transducer with metallopeptidase domain
MLASSFPAASSGTAIHAVTRIPKITLDVRWSLAIAALWLALSAWRLATLAVHLYKLRRIWHSARPMEAASFQPLLGNATLCESPLVDRPGVLGFFRPRILLPVGLREQLSEAELGQVILHEMEHLRRHDDWTNLVQKFVLALFPLNLPLLWLERELCRQREIACDEGVVRQTQAPKAYATCLTRMAQAQMEAKWARRDEALTLGAWRRRSEVVERVHAMLRGSVEFSRQQSRAIALGFSVVLCVAAIALAHAPQMVIFANPQPAQVAAVASPLVRQDVPGKVSADPANQLPRVTSRSAKASATAGMPTRPAGQTLVVSEDDNSPELTSSAWVVLTDWDSNPTDHAQPGAQFHPTPATPQVVEVIWTMPAESPHRVAAVPVANGWLVFQL